MFSLYNKPRFVVSLAEMRPADIICNLTHGTHFLRSAGVENRPGCYAVFDSSHSCLYVGRSIMLATRIQQHWIDQQDGNGTQWRVAGVTEWYYTRPFAPCNSRLHVWFDSNHRRLEILLINHLKPKHNHHRYKIEAYELTTHLNEEAIYVR